MKKNNINYLIGLSSEIERVLNNFITLRPVENIYDMKKLTLLFIFLCFLGILGNSQIVISEIMYNPPESGNDSLEYIEIVNTGNNMVDLTGYRFVNGVDYTFPALTLSPGEFLVIAVDSTALENLLGISCRQWTDGALNNGGERIAIEDNFGNLIDEVEYDDEMGWPTAQEGTDGEGASIELCDVTSDNSLGDSWRAAEIDLGVMINGASLKGTPGTSNTVRCLPRHDHYVAVQSNFFNPSDITINVGQTVLWENLQGTHNVNGTTTTFPNNPESFFSGPPSGGNWMYTHTFDTPGEYDYQCDPHVSLGMTGTITVLDVNPYPEESIGVITAPDNNGVPDSIGKQFTIEGVVHSPTFYGGGTQVILIDENRDGIQIFNQNSTFGYDPQLGDRLRVTGVVNQYFGVTQFDINSLDLVSSANPVFDPRTVNELDETTESDLVLLEGLTLVDPNEWGMGTSSGFTVRATNGQDTFDIRVDNDSELFGPENPGDQEFDIVGIGGQFDRDQPLFEGYQILPRYSSDLRLISSTRNQINFSVKIHPNPASDILFINTEETLDRFEIFSLNGELVKSGQVSDNIDIADLKTGAYLLRVWRGNSYGSIPFYVMR